MYQACCLGYIKPGRVIYFKDSYSVGRKPLQAPSGPSYVNSGPRYVKDFLWSKIYEALLVVQDEKVLLVHGM